MQVWKRKGRPGWLRMYFEGRELIGLPDQLLDVEKETPVTPRFGPAHLEG